MGFTIEAICSWDGNESAEHIHAVMAHVSIQGRDDVTVIQVTPDNRKALSERLFDIFGVETWRTAAPTGNIIINICEMISPVPFFSAGELH